MVGSAAFAGLALSSSSAGAAQEAADNIPAPSVQTKAAVENGLRLGPIVETANGKVRGYVSGGIHTFRGLRYGAPTGGANRFKPPVAPEPWTGVMETYVAAGGNIAPQAASRPDAERPWTNALDPDSPPMSEDCLFLNLFTPGLNNDGKRPVMVFLHGGAWATGAGTGSMFDGTRLARRGDTVIISINHRLNLFGYLYLAEILGEDYANSGNSGVLDIIAALRWVRDNVANFGGDPQNVTVFGWSSGGSEVCQLLAMPAATGLFHKAIVQSGALLSLRTRDVAAHATEQVLARLGLSQADAGKVLTLPAAAFLKNAAGGAPTFDGRSVPHQIWTPDAPPSAANVPLIIGGTNSELVIVASDKTFDMDERDLLSRLEKFLGANAKPVLAAYRRGYPDATPGDLLIFIATGLWTTRRTTQLAERKVNQGGAPLYFYRWEWRSPLHDGKYLSPHGVDLPFVWDNLDRAGYRVANGTGGQALADRMSARWLAFARTGTPNVEGLVNWDPYTTERRSTLVIDQTDRSIDDPHKDERLALAEVPDSAIGGIFRALRS